MKKNLYDIIAADSGRVMASGITRKEVCERIGIGASYVIPCANDHVCYQGEYYIHAREMENWEEQFAAQWQQVTGRLKRRGGLERINLVMRDA